MTPSYGSGSGNENLYTVEVRTTLHPHIIHGLKDDTSLGDFVVTHEWKRLPQVILHNAPDGFGSLVKPHINPMALNYCRLVNHQCALAMAHNFLAWLIASQLCGSLSIEVRIVCVNFSYSYATKEVGVGDVIASKDYSKDFKPRNDPPASGDANEVQVKKYSDAAARELTSRTDAAVIAELERDAITREVAALKAERRELRTSRDAVRADLERVLREEVETTP